MEAAKIDWSSMESVFVIDESYEHINAPQWVDFLSSSPPPPHLHPPPDHFFCRPECKHPQTADDFLKPNLMRSVTTIGLTHPRTSNREPILKNQHEEEEEDESENQNPNYSPELVNKNGGLKDIPSQPAKDLFGGGDILAKITDLCSELKKMASLTRPKDTATQHPPLKTKQPPPPPTSSSRSKHRPVLGERPDLLKMTPYIPTKSPQKYEDIENVPKSLNMKNMKANQQEGLFPIRTNPPTPQGFSATRATTSSTPSKGPKSRLLNQKKEILKEVEQDGTFRAELGDKYHTQNESVIAGKQGRALDVLWFLKPCTL